MVTGGYRWLGWLCDGELELEEWRNRLVRVVTGG